MNKMFSTHNIRRVFFALALTLGMSSCNDFVDVVPKGNTIPTTVEDLSRLMNNGSIAISSDGDYDMNGISAGVFYYELLSDDYMVTDNPSDALYASYRNIPFVQNVMKWNDYYFNAAESDYTWDKLYHSNYIANYVLSRIDDVEASASVKREEVKGRALVHRAMNYFLLTNLYGKQYVKGQANDALSVPLILVPTVTESYPRATVAEVYAQIKKDIDEAVSLLKTNVAEFNNIPSRATALALRARINLWMQDYDAAYTDAAEALNLKNTLINYNQVVALMPGMPMFGLSGYDTNIETNPEILYERYVTEHPMTYYTPKMKAIVDTDNDLRYSLFIAALPMYGYMGEYGWVKHRHSGIDVAEVYLTKAEAAVRKSSKDVNTALQTLNALRQNRYAAATYTDCTISDPTALLDEILKERRREIIFTEMSFLDKKRMTADATTAQPMERTFEGQTYTISVDSPKWQVPIPLNVKAVNPLIKD